MAIVMKGSDFARKLRDIALNKKTLYVMGCFGDRLTAPNKTRYINHHPYNQDPVRKNMINSASEDTWGFDCVCLLKGVLWGWTGDANRSYGGAIYNSNGVPDYDADGFFNLCSDISTDFSKINIGEAVWTNGHIGVYIGNGQCVECTPAWANKVQITACNKDLKGFKTRIWKKHGKIPYIEYDINIAPNPTTTSKKSVDEIAREVIAGKWGNGSDRKNKLTAAGYDYGVIQKKVDEICSGKTTNTAPPKTTTTPKPATPTKKSVDEIAREVIAGKWGNGSDRKNKLTAAGYDWGTVQKKVDEICSGKTSTPAKKSVDEIAREVIAGKWGNGSDRKNKLTAAGYDWGTIQRRVDELLS